jgi:membrane protein
MSVRNEGSSISQRVAVGRDRVKVVTDRAQRTLLWQVWDRMLEIEFVDRSVALAGKAFVSFFPLIIVVSAFMPESIRDSILSTVTHKLGLEGGALVIFGQAFSSADDIRRATGILGLVYTIFFASSFTTALQRLYVRAWRRPPVKTKGQYVRGPAWFLVVLACSALLGGLRGLVGDGPQLVVFAVVSLAATFGLWWFTAWFLLMGQVRWRVLVPTGVVTAVALGGYALSATIWMPESVTRNETQFGFIGVALALVSWFTGAAICIIVGACVGSVFAADTGRVGAVVRGPEISFLVAGAAPSLPPPTRGSLLSEAFQPTEDDAGTS